MTEIRLPSFKHLPEQQLDFLTSRRELVTPMLPAYADLRSRLLGLGGLEVVLPPYDLFSEVQRQRQIYDVQQVLGRGEPWLGSNATVETGAENNCHANVARLASSGRGAIVSGWALARDGLWREHSWLIVRSDTPGAFLIETTQEWLLYYGYLLDADETRWFIYSELGSDAPVPGAA
jgi:hypothetical protein